MFSWRIPLPENGCANSYSVGMLIKMLKKMAAFVSRKYQDEIFRRVVPVGDVRRRNRWWLMMSDRLQTSEGSKGSFERDRIRQLNDGILNWFYGIKIVTGAHIFKMDKTKNPQKYSFGGFLSLDTINRLFSSNPFHASADARKALFPEHAESGRL